MSHQVRRVTFSPIPPIRRYVYPHSEYDCDPGHVMLYGHSVLSNSSRCSYTDMDVTEVFQCQGVKGGVLYSDGSGLFYRVKEKRKTRWRLVCHNQACKGTATLTNPDNEDVWGLTHNAIHSCEPSPMFNDVVNLRKKILDRCKLDLTTNLSRIFIEETTKSDVSQEIACLLTFARMESTMLKTRKRHGFPKVPEDFTTMVESINEYRERFNNIYGEPFLSGLVGEGDEIAVVFLVRQLLSVLQQGDIHLDGTFKVVPKKPKAYQLCTIMVMYRDHAFPVAFCLMTKKTAQLYKLILRHLKNIQPISPSNVVSDYEAGIKCAIADEFPQTKHVGCWFHFTQSIYKRVQRIGLIPLFRLNNAVNKGAHMLMAIALLPPEKIEEGYFVTATFFEMQAKPELSQGDHTKIDALLRYFKSQWIGRVGAKSFSVYGQKHRTNNSQESFHSKLNSMVGTAHPNIWSFIGALIIIGKEAATDYVRIEAGESISRNRKTKWLLQDRQIMEAQQKLEDDQITIFQFLSTMAHRVRPESRVEDPEEDDQEEVVPLDDGVENQGGVANVEDVEEEDLNRVVEEQHNKLAALEVDLNDVPAENTLACVVCYINKRTYTVEPCAHLALCGHCTAIHRTGRIMENKRLPVLCPVCRGIVSLYKKTFY